MSIKSELIQAVRDQVDHSKLQMKLVDVRYIPDDVAPEDKLLVEYTAKGRVDFRQLVRDLHREFGCRIEMRQISVREHEKRLGAGVQCGRMICFRPYCMTAKWPGCYQDRNEDYVTEQQDDEYTEIRSAAERDH